MDNQMVKANINKQLLTRVILAVWIAVWALFEARPYLKKDLLKEYSHLWTLSAEGKRSFVTGEELYDFIGFCNNSVLTPSTYEFVGLEENSLDKPRVMYYLYPNIMANDPEYIFVYKVMGYERHGYGIFKGIDGEKFILKKRK